MKKTIKLFIILVLLLTSLYSQKTVISYMRWPIDVEINSTFELIKIFEKEHPGIKVKPGNLT